MTNEPDVQAFLADLQKRYNEACEALGIAQLSVDQKIEVLETLVRLLKAQR